MTEPRFDLDPARPEAKQLLAAARAGKADAPARLQISWTR
jgi:hypothetical protein